MKLSEILRAGKQRIEQHGWCQGDELALNEGPDGKCCAVTAMTKIEAVYEASSDAPFKVFRDANGLGITGIGTWNDAPGRTVEDVLTAYDKAIAAAEVLENGGAA